MSLSRNVGHTLGIPPLFFGHAACAPTPRDVRPFDPETDIAPGNLLAVAMSDADARDWGRSFDIVHVDHIAEGGQLQVTYYGCEGVEKGAAPPEESQINMVWKKGCPRAAEHQSTMHRDNVLCPIWVHPPRRDFI